MSKNRRDEALPPAVLTTRATIALPAEPAAPFNGPFRCVGMARTVDGFVTVTVDFGADGIMTAMTLGRAQSAPHGQPYVAGEAKKILMMQCLGA